jgi:hypothetical protein
MLRPHRGVLPTVRPTADVDDSAQVIGDVQIGNASRVWMNAVLRGDGHWIRIGARTNIQDGTIIQVMNGTDPTTIGTAPDLPFDAAQGTPSDSRGVKVGPTAGGAPAGPPKLQRRRTRS